MPALVIVAVVGFVAQLIDGSLGMGYGVTSASLLLAAGTAPAIASASVHLAEVGTSLVSGLSHWRFGNVDWRAVVPLAVPGAIFGFLGAVVLTSVPAEAAKPVVACFLFLMGLYFLGRFTVRPLRRRARRERALPRQFLAPLGAVAGFLDAAGGGGWGAITTTTLVASERIEPRKAIGSASAAEFLVSLGASAGFLVGLGSAPLDLALVGVLLAGGVVAAPLAAWLVRRLRPSLLGSAVGGMLLATNAGTFLGTVGADGAAVTAVAYLAIGAAVAVSLVAARRQPRLREQPA